MINSSNNQYAKEHKVVPIEPTLAKIIFAKVGSIGTTLCSLAYWLLLLFIMFCHVLS